MNQWDWWIDPYDKAFGWEFRISPRNNPYALDQFQFEFQFWSFRFTADWGWSWLKRTKRK